MWPSTLVLTIIELYQMKTLKVEYFWPPNFNWIELPECILTVVYIVLGTADERIEMMKLSWILLLLAFVKTIHTL